jgi:hypothetical protein
MAFLGFVWVLISAETFGRNNFVGQAADTLHQCGCSVGLGLLAAIMQ